MDDSDQTARRIFETARQLPMSERAAYLDTMCAGNGTLQRHVEELLIQSRRRDAAPENPQPQREQPPAAGDRAGATVRISSTPQEQIGDLIGHFKLLEKIGEGGFGLVYVAEQREPVKRRVALKIIKLGMDTQQVVARFEAERQALALMDHPSIAKVFDAGATETGRPYFVMELVRGIRITTYCDQNRLTVPQRLELFILVCQAIQHAHQKGVIHRDIKPSNILVSSHDGVPVAKVIDFGIAKATQLELTEKTVYTQLQQFIGTPAYMSPEQAEMSSLDIDTRSDVYSLGVLLYELLTGTTPFDITVLMEAGLDAVRHTIREKEPPPPSSRIAALGAEKISMIAACRSAEASRLIHALRGDLNLIVMKCLEKDRTRRYETANALAQDVKRFLNNEPVEARPPDTLYRFGKLVRRNRAAFAAAVTGAAALLLVTGLSLRLYVQETRLRKQAEAAAEVAKAKIALEVELHERMQMSEIVGAAALSLAEGKFGQAEERMSALPSSFPGPAATNHTGMAVICSILGDWDGREERWPAALTNYSRVASILPSDYGVRCTLAALSVQAGELKRYQEIRDEILNKFPANSDVAAAELISRTCLMVPASPAFPENLKKMVETLGAATPANSRWKDIQLVEGLADYRRGNFNDAVERLLKLPADEKPANRTVQIRAVLAMSEFRLNHTNAARTLLAQAVQDAGQSTNRDGDWRNWIVAQALVREARALIGPER